MGNIEIIFSSDDNYAQHLGVTLCSIFENKNDGYSVNVNVIDGGISSDNKDKLEILSKKYLFKINYLHIITENFNDLFVSDHVSKATYYRILIPEIISEKVSKVLYLDCDLVICGDLLGLFDLDISSYFAGASEDAVVGAKENLGLEDCDRYFNAGVLLINVDKWREGDVSGKAMSFIRNNPGKIRFWDQDALNYVLRNKWLLIDKKYNYPERLIGEYRKMNGGKKNTPTVIHFSGNLKPWNYAYSGYGKSIYKNYLNKTPWRGAPCKDRGIKNGIKKILFFILPYRYVEKIVRLKKQVRLFCEK